MATPTSPTNLQISTQFQPQDTLVFDFNTSYLEYLITGKLSDITIFAPLPPALNAPEKSSQTASKPQKWMRFDLHRFVIAARSPVFAVLLQRNPIIKIPIRSDVFQALLWLLYTDDIASVKSIPLELFPAVMWASEYYAIKPGKLWALNITSKLTTTVNCVDLANDLYTAYKLLDFEGFEDNAYHDFNENNSLFVNNDQNKQNIPQNHLRIHPVMPSPVLTLQSSPPALRFVVEFIIQHLYTLQDQINVEPLQEFTSLLHQLHPGVTSIILDVDSTLSFIIHEGGAP